MVRERPDEPWRRGAPTEPGTAWERLAAGAYVGARDGNLSPDTAFDLACFLMEWAAPNRLFDDLAAASLAGDDPDRLAGLVRRALDAVGYVPDFAIEPRLLAQLERALATVAPDLRATGLNGHARLVVMEGAEPPRAHVRYEGGTGHTSGLGPGDAAGCRGADLLVTVADELQDAVMDALAAAWPVCPEHQFGAHPRALDGAAVWWCAGGAGHVISPIGRLG